MKDLFSYTKLFTILIAIFFIFGLIACFFENEILFSFLAFVALVLMTLFLKFDFKKVILLYFIFFVGLIRANQVVNLPNVFDDIVSNDAIIYGQIISSKDISIKNQKIKFFLKAKNATVLNKKYENKNVKFLISMDYNQEILNKISIGDYVSLKGKLRHPNASTNPHQFDYQKYLLNNDVKDILYVDEFKKVKEPNFKNDKWYFVLKQFEKIRNDIIEKHSKYVKSPKLEILGGIVFGSETINPDEEVKEHFKNSGLLHLLAASGLNVALIYGIWWWIASLIRFPYNLSIFTGAGFVILYTFMTGFPPSILRASIMLLFVLLGKIIDRSANSLALIFFVGFLMLLAFPKMLFDVGFQLSFVVTIGLVVCVPVIVSKFENLDKKYKEKYKKSFRVKKYFISLFSPSSLVGLVAIPLVAQLCVIPLQMHYFNNFTPFSLLANIAVVPFIGILSFIGFASSILALIPVLNEVMIYLFDSVANPLLGFLIKISEIFSSFKYSLISTMGLNLFQIIVFWVVGLIFILNLKNNFKNKKQIITLLLFVVMFFCSFVRFNNNNFEIMMFDVENADCFLLKTPKNKYVMIDTGKSSYKSVTSAQMIINKYLKNERIKNLEILIVTHFDSDHCAGVVDILKENNVKRIILQNENVKSKTSYEIFDYLNKNKIDFEIAKNNEITYEEDDLKIKTFKADVLDDNESSIVTLITYKNENILFMGDGGVLAYEKIKNYLPKNIQIIKVGHHGAKNSLNNKMLKALKPEYALISVGYNKFNHPHFSILNLLDENNVKNISTKNYGFSKIILKDNIKKAYYFDSKKKVLKPIEFNSKEAANFYKSEYVQDFIKENLR